MKKVAMFSDGWGRRNTYERCLGVYESIKNCKEDVVIHRYNAYGNWSEDFKYNMGEYSIYKLANIDVFDGILLEGNNILYESVLRDLYSRLKETQVPVVDMTRETEGFYHSGLDNSGVLREIVKHLYEEHGCRTFVYAGGPEENYENIKRKDGFISAMEELNIPQEDYMILYGTWEFSTGHKHFYSIYESFKDFPDAVVCGNDTIAIGIVDEANKHGLNAPEDFAITGFDNCEKAFYYKPQITSIKHNFEEICRIAMNMFFGIWDGKDVARKSLCKAEIVYAESCGCPIIPQDDYRDYMRDSIVRDETTVLNLEKLAHYEAVLADSDNISDIIMNTYKFMWNMGCDGYYIVLDERVLFPYDGKEFMEHEYNKEHFLVACAYEGNDDESLRFSSEEELEKYLNDNGAGCVYTYTPIHFRDNVVGYTIVKNGRFFQENTFFYDAHCILTNRLNDIYKKAIIIEVNQKLEAVYNRDPLTGLYNRVAYTQMVIPKFENYCEHNISCAITFFDVDYFKNINDTCGHHKGDEILVNIARILDTIKPEDGIAYRFGGDEFVVFFPNATEKVVNEFKDKVEIAMREQNIQLSVGCIITDPCSGKSLEDYMQLADKEMYRVKSERKAK